MQFERQRDHFADGIDSFPMTGNAGQAAKLGPASVSIHNDGHVFGQELLFQFARQFLLGKVFEVG
jgi:hypothetical protein